MAVIYQIQALEFYRGSNYLLTHITYNPVDLKVCQNQPRRP
jgi:hypothetical protein